MVETSHALVTQQRRRLFDSHFHLIDDVVPLIPNNGYVPPNFSLPDYLAQAPIGTEGGVIVSGSFQAYDQTYLLHYLQQLGNGWVGVAQIPPETTDDEILSLDAAGQ
jgi:predicted TIM-barrel fold metal-dependent hydrolase